MPNKLTDTEIKKALELLLELVLVEGCLQRAKTISNALDLINRLQAENEKLKEACERIAEDWSEVTIEKDKLFDEAEATINKYKADNERLSRITRTMVGEIKAEAYTEFAERLRSIIMWSPKNHISITAKDVEMILKEMVGEDNGEKDGTVDE